MNYHKNSYTGAAKKKILIRVLIVAAALLCVSAATLAYGNYLKSKAQNTETAGIGAGRDKPPSGAGREENDEVKKGVETKSACLALDAQLTSEAACGRIDEMHDAKKDGVTIVLVGRDAYLTYASDAVAKFTHQKPSDTAPIDVVSAAVRRAKEHSMRTSALVFASEDFAEGSFRAQIDALIASDASALGFDEFVIVLPISPENFGREDAEKVVSYLATLSEKLEKKTSLGVCLPYNVFATPELSPQIELIARTAGFLALDLTPCPNDVDGATEYISNAVDHLAGSFRAYSLRAVLDASESEVAEAQIKALANAQIKNYMFASALPVTDDETTDESDDTPNTPDYDYPWQDDDPPAPEDEQTEAPEPPAAPETAPTVPTAPTAPETTAPAPPASTSAPETAAPSPSEGESPEAPAAGDAEDGSPQDGAPNDASDPSENIE